MAKRKPEQLEEYRRKRSAQTTTEPFGTGTGGRSRLFVVQQHAARRLHYDLRLEWGGVLHSWAVPKGPSLDPEDKRLAVHVEDHPVEYADFEGRIPDGNYGAGAVIVWDRGRWVSVGDPQEGLAKGKLLFDLWGYKLRGRWTLFRTKGEAKDWLLMKKPDSFADPEGEPPPQSIFSGLTVEQLGQGADPAEEVREDLARLEVPRRDLRPDAVEPMLAETADSPFSHPDWLFELKYDGFRLMASRGGGRASLRYRRGHVVTEVFPEIASAVRALPYDGLILDGEVVVLDPSGKPSFQRLQQRVHLTRRLEIENASVHLQATLFLFDLPACEGFDLRSLPLTERKRILERIVPPVGPLRFSEHYPERGEAMFREVERLGFEGLVAKRADSAYRSGRSGDWLKVRADRTSDFAVVGYSLPKGSRSGFGALHLAVNEGTEFVYAGRAGSGFSDDQRTQILEALDRDRRDEPACTGEVPQSAGHVWVVPRLVCEVRYKEWTEDGLLRQPVFLRVREDKGVRECPRPAVEAPVKEPPRPRAIAAERVVHFTNLDKVFWPEEGYSKGDLVEYYRSVSPWLLPYLKDRPVVLTRYPDGIEGKSFFQKDAPAFVPDWLRTETMWSEHAAREIHYFVCEDEESLLYVANLGTIPLHLWSSRIASLENPDWCILDLDPKQAPFEHVVRVARALRSLCNDIGLDCFVKSSGSTGLHVLLPLGGQCSYEQSRSLAALLGRVVASELPDVATLRRSLAAREGRVYIDSLQNGHGRLLVAPFSARPLPGAPVSAPLRWSEVNRRLDIRRFTMKTLPGRLRRMKQDPLLPVLERVPDLVEALARLARRLGERE